MQRPFELQFTDLNARIDEMVAVTFDDLQSQFLTLPKGNGFVDFSAFQVAYECLKSETESFSNITRETVWNALRRDALALVVLRTILGFSPPEWAELATSETGVDVPQSIARGFDTRVRQDRDWLRPVRTDWPLLKPYIRVDALVRVAVSVLNTGAPSAVIDFVHRLAKFDTSEGVDSLQHAANFHVPYAVLLYERYLGRPFASHRDSVSELVGDVMESAIEERLARAHITFRKTRRAERLPGFEQAPDFFVPTEIAPSAIIEAKITNDDGTARDKVARILRLAEMRDRRTREGGPSFELIACVDGRGFGVRKKRHARLASRDSGQGFHTQHAQPPYRAHGTRRLPSGAENSALTPALRQAPRIARTTTRAAPQASGGVRAGTADSKDRFRTAAVARMKDRTFRDEQNQAQSREGRPAPSGRSLAGGNSESAQQTRVL